MKLCRIIISCLCLLFIFSCLPVQAAQNINFVSLTDIHFSPFVNCEGAKPCALVKKLNQSPASAWGAILSAAHLSLPAYHEETNYPLLISSLNAAKNTAKLQHARFVLVLGDMLGHDYRRLYKLYTGDRSYAGYQSFVGKTYQFINQALQNAFPETDIYMTVGNNDSYHGDYVTNLRGPFFQDQASLWSRLIKSSANRSAMNNQFRNAGYYAVDLPESVKLIVLNSNLFSSKARGKNLDQAADNELLWLNQQLSLVKSKHQTAFIAMHIPEGVDVYATLRIRGLSLVEFWDNDYIKQFQQIMNIYAGEVKAIFAGHLHADWMQILRYQEMREIPVIGTPSISPIFGNNPGYKLYSYSDESKKLIDFTTYYLPLSDSKAWTMEYEFNRVYQPNCYNCPVTNGINLIHKNGYLSDYYRLFYAVSTHSQPMTTAWNPYYWCAIWHVKLAAYKNCLG